MTTQPANRIQDLSAAIMQAIRPILNADDDAGVLKDAKKAAGDAFKEGVETSMGQRESMLIKVAELSRTMKLTVPEIEQISKRIPSMNNLDPKTPEGKARAKTIGTLVGEIRNVSHPMVRDHVPAFDKMVGELWDAEGLRIAEDKAAPKPLRIGFQRRYHCLTGVFKLAADGIHLDGDGLLEEAKRRDPRRDPERVAKMLAKIVSDLTAFHHDFQHEDIGLCIEALNRITADELVRTSIHTDAEPKVEPAVVTPVVVATPEPEPAKIEPTTDQVLDGEDIFAGILGPVAPMTHLQAAA